MGGRKEREDKEMVGRKESDMQTVSVHVVIKD